MLHALTPVAILLPWSAERTKHGEAKILPSQSWRLWPPAHARGDCRCARTPPCRNRQDPRSARQAVRLRQECLRDADPRLGSRQLDGSRRIAAGFRVDAAPGAFARFVAGRLIAADVDARARLRARDAP